MRLLRIRILSHQLHLPNPMPEIRRIQHDREPAIRPKREPIRLKLCNRIQPEEIVLETKTPVREMRAHELVYLAPVFDFGEGRAEEGTSLHTLLDFPFQCALW